jgi:tRNA(Ile)-lysidine synthase
MLQQFQNFIAKNTLFQPQQKILLAISGGLDSIVMLDLFAKTGYQFAIAHCNFQLRADESEQDQIFVQKLAQKYQIPLFEKYFDIKEITLKNKVSVQMLARELRYKWFSEILDTEGFAYIATAHHLNDSLETVLHNLAKGTGISGLRGILVKNELNVIRPLSFATRQQILTYSIENELVWREDSSNASDKYHRNLLRHEVVPVLKQINPNLEQTLATTLQRLQTVEKVYENYLENLRKTFFKRENNIFYLNLEDFPKDLVLVYEMIKDFGYGFSQSEQIFETLDKTSGKQFHSEKYLLIKDRNQLVITSKPIEQPIENQDKFHFLIDKQQETLETPLGNFIFQQILKVSNFEFKNNSNVAYLDADKLKFPLLLRNWQQGDKFHPLGMNQNKKISDFLINLKTPLNLKSRILVLISENKIVWVVGKRLDNRFKITDKTKNILEVNFEEKN